MRRTIFSLNAGFARVCALTTASQAFAFFAEAAACRDSEQGNLLIDKVSRSAVEHSHLRASGAAPRHRRGTECLHTRSGGVDACVSHSFFMVFQPLLTGRSARFIAFQS